MPSTQTSPLPPEIHRHPRPLLPLPAPRSPHNLWDLSGLFRGRSHTPAVSTAAKRHAVPSGGDTRRRAGRGDGGRCRLAVERTADNWSINRHGDGNNWAPRGRRRFGRAPRTRMGRHATKGRGHPARMGDGEVGGGGGCVSGSWVRWRSRSVGDRGPTYVGGLASHLSRADAEACVDLLGDHQVGDHLQQPRMGGCGGVAEGALLCGGCIKHECGSKMIL